MILKIGDEVDLVIRALNRKGGPAAPGSVTGTWYACDPSGSITIELDSAQPLKAMICGTASLFPGSHNFKIALISFMGTRQASNGSEQTVEARFVVNVVDSNEDIISIEAGEPRPTNN